MKPTWIRQLIQRKPLTIRTRNLKPRLLQLEARENPASFYIDDAFIGATPGSTITDADPVLAGNQTAIVGGDINNVLPGAFSRFYTLAAEVGAFNATAVAPPTDGDTIIVNNGTYAEDVGIANALTLRFQQAAGVTVKSLETTTAGATIELNTPLTLGDVADKSITSVISGTSGFVKVGSGRLLLTNLNTFTGVASVNAGIVGITTDTAFGAVGVTGNTIVANGAAIEISTGITVGETITIEGTGVANAGALQLLTGSTATWTGGITLAGTGARLNSDASSVFTVNGQIDGAAKALTLGGAGDTTIGVQTNTTLGKINTGLGGSIIKDGAGKATLWNQTNNFGATGAASVVITITDGILAQEGEFSGTVGSTSTSGILPAVTVPSYVLINGGTLQGTRAGVGATFLATPKGITLGANGGKLDVLDATVGNLNIYTGVVAGPAGATLTRVGAVNSVLSMAGASTYAGPTRVSGGIFRVRTTADRFPTGTALTVDDTPGAIFDLNGVAQKVGSINGGGSNSQINFGANFLTVGDATSTTFNGFFTGSGGGFIKVGTGKLTLTNGGNFQTANSQANAGILELANPTGNVFGTAGVTIGSGGTVTTISTAAVGNISGTVTVNGILSPGGTDTVNTTATNILGTGNLTVGATGKIVFNLRGATPGFAAGNHDQLLVTGTVSPNNGVLSIDAGGFVPNIGDKFTLIENDGTDAITTIFSNLSEGATLISTDGQTFKVSYLGFSGTDNDVIIEKVAAGTTRYVDDAWVGMNPGDPIADLDPVLANNQPGVFGTSGFAFYNDAYNASALNDYIIVNKGTYAENVAMDKLLSTTFQEGTSIFNKFSSANSGALAIINSPANVQFGTADSTSFAGVLVGSGGLIKNGSGGFTLTGTVNSYSGATLINDGIFVNGAVNSFSTASAVTLAGTARLTLNGFNAAIANLTAPATTFVENAAPGNATLTVGSNGLAVTIAGSVIDGAGTGTLSFVKVGAGALTFPAVNTFTGPFVLAAGTYSVATFPNGGVAGPFGASSSASGNLVIRGSGTLTYTGPSTTTDRNIAIGVGAATATITVSTAASTLSVSGVVTRETATANSFTKSGAGTLDFTAANAFQTPNDIPNLTYGLNATGNITVSAGELRVVNLRTNGTLASRPGGSRTVSLSAGAILTTTGTISMDPSGAYVNQFSGTGKLQLRNQTASKTNPSITYDNGPAGGDGAPLGIGTGAPDSTTATTSFPIFDLGSVNAVITGKANRNAAATYSGDLRIDANLTGTASLQFIGLTSLAEGTGSLGKHNMHYVLRGNNSGFTGEVLIANADLALSNITTGTGLSLGAANKVTFNSVDDPLTNNTASLFLFGRSHIIGSLTDSSDGVTTKSFIRNGSLSATNGGTNSTGSGVVTVGSNTDASLTVVQAVDGNFNGGFGDGPNDRGLTGVVGTYRKLNVIKQGTGKLTLNGASNLTGTVSLSTGTLIVNGTLGTATSIGTAATTTLGGTGTIPVSSITARVTGGTDGGAGKLATSGNFVVTSAGTLATDLTGSAAVAGTDYDQINVTGTVTITNATLAITSPGAPTLGTPLVIINNDLAEAVIGKFTNLPNEGSTISAGGNTYAISYVGGDGNDVTLTRQNPLQATGFIVNAGNPQRSRITTIEVLFNNPVLAANFQSLNAITLTRTAVSSLPTGSVNDVIASGPTANNHITVVQGTGTSLILTFDNSNSFITSDIGVENGSLSDGYWRLAVGAFQSPLNSLELRRLFGDSTVSAGGLVDGADGIDFGNNFNSGSIAYDFNNDGIVDGSDGTAFGNRFGNSL